MIAVVQTEFDVFIRGELVGSVVAASALDARLAALSDFDVDDIADITASIHSCENPVQAGIDRTASGAIGQP